jgi:hypothetical protein
VLLLLLLLLQTLLQVIDDARAARSLRQYLYLCTSICTFLICQYLHFWTGIMLLLLSGLQTLLQVMEIANCRLPASVFVRLYW